MKTSRTIQFAISAAILSAGCAIVLSEESSVLSSVCFSLSGIVLTKRADFTQPVSWRDFSISLAVLLVFLAVMIGLQFLIPKPIGERLSHNPAFVGLMWFSMIVILILEWRKEKKTSDA